MNRMVVKRQGEPAGDKGSEPAGDKGSEPRVAAARRVKAY
jgi:hypothetical protein